MSWVFSPQVALAQTTDPVIMAAGDIVGTSTSTTSNWFKTSDLILSINPNLVLTLGDNQYDTGALSAFNTYYNPSWGRFKSITRPSPGNHDYGTSGATGYYTYFGDLATPRQPGCTSGCLGYYSFDVGTWHIIALNSEISQNSLSSTQGQWLTQDLANHPNTCTLAYWHKPRFSSGTNHGSNSSFSPFWQALYSAKADIVLGGHDHLYERFAPQDQGGTFRSDGVREFVVGTGGRSLYSFNSTSEPNSEARYNASYGVLKLTLHPASYDWQFTNVNKMY